MDVVGARVARAQGDRKGRPYEIVNLKYFRFFKNLKIIKFKIYFIMKLKIKILKII